MFWKETKGLKELNPSSKIAITLFLLIAGIGYLLGFFNILLSYSPVDQEPGLSLRDIQISFYGARETTILEASIDGSMKEHFQSDAEYQATKDWLAGGASEEGFAAIEPIFESSCNTCHSADVQVPGVVTETYADVEPLLAQDTGKSISRLVSISHTHVLAILPLIFLLVFIFSFTAFKEKVKTVVMALAFLTILLDVGSWWLAKTSPAAATMVIIGGSSLAVAFAVLILGSLYDMYVKRT